MSIGISQHCLVLNELGLNPGHESGAEASNRITNAAVLADIINFTAVSGSARISILSLISGELAGIKSSSFYKSSEVDDCIGKIRGLQGFFLGSGLTAITCGLKEDNAIFDP